MMNLSRGKPADDAAVAHHETVPHHSSTFDNMQILSDFKCDVATQLSLDAETRPQLRDILFSVAYRNVFSDDKLQNTE